MKTVSPRWSLNTVDWKKIGKGALIAVGGALLAYLGQFLTSTDFGQWTPLVAAIGSVLVNIAYKFSAKTSF